MRAANPTIAPYAARTAPPSRGRAARRDVGIGHCAVSLPPCTNPRPTELTVLGAEMHCRCIPALPPSPRPTGPKSRRDDRAPQHAPPTGMVDGESTPDLATETWPQQPVRTAPGHHRNGGDGTVGMWPARTTQAAHSKHPTTETKTAQNGQSRNARLPKPRVQNAKPQSVIRNARTQRRKTNDTIRMPILDAVMASRHRGPALVGRY